MQAPQTWLFGAALLVMLVCLHYLMVAPFAWGRLIKPLLALLLVVVASASYFMQAFGVVLDPSMIRNVLHTDVAESRELMSWRLVTHLLLYAGLPMLLLWRVRSATRPFFRPGLAPGQPAAGYGVLVGALLAVYQPMSALMRNQKELRYLITPGNVLWSLGVVVAANTRGAAKPRQVIGEDAQAGPRLAARTRPLVVVLVVGETARAANWGLNGYERQTTPQLAQRPVVSFAEVTSCGTNTEVSLPCMFAPVGRRDYDEGPRARQPVAAARAGPRRRGRGMAGQPERLQGRLRRPAHAGDGQAQPTGPVQQWPLPGRSPAGRPA
jgi:lipid A ethanolaminephosphotransferase